jgi:hypothetical protein
LHNLFNENGNLSDISINDRRKAVIENPGLTSWFIQKRMSIFMKIVVSKLMSVKDFWYRYEWQHRGSGHVHGFLWLENAPNVDELNLNDPDVQQLLCDFHDTYTCTNNPAPGLQAGHNHPCQDLYSNCEDLNSDYAELVNRVQLHTKCSKDYCLGVNRKTKKLQCRFGFPKDLRDKTIIQVDNGRPELLTARNDPLVNSHNKSLLQAWRANMDIKPVISSEFVVRYDLH